VLILALANDVAVALVAIITRTTMANNLMMALWDGNLIFILLLSLASPLFLTRSMF
jgi:hypothetical protein